MNLDYDAGKIASSVYFQSFWLKRNLSCQVIIINLGYRFSGDREHLEGGGDLYETTKGNNDIGLVIKK